MNIKYSLALLILLVGVGCSNFQQKKTDTVSYKMIDGNKVKVTVYDDGSQTIENLSLKKNPSDVQWIDGENDRTNRD